MVTGGAGFIGGHLCRRLLDAGHEVLAVDNYYSGSRTNVADLLDNPRFELLRHDVTFPLYVEVDEIYHLACPASPIFYQRDPVQTTKTSVVGSINMLGLAKRTKARILLSSTSEVYGDPTVHPQPETYWGHVNPIGTRVVLRRGQALRRDAVLRLPAPARHADQGGPNLQHLRAVHAPRRRPSGVELHRAGPAWRTDHDLRRRLPDALVLLRRRHGRRA